MTPNTRSVNRKGLSMALSDRSRVNCSLCLKVGWESKVMKWENEEKTCGFRGTHRYIPSCFSFFLWGSTQQENGDFSSLSKEHHGCCLRFWSEHRILLGQYCLGYTLKVCSSFCIYILPEYDLSCSHVWFFKTLAKSRDPAKIYRAWASAMPHHMKPEFIHVYPVSSRVSTDIYSINCYGRV